MLPSLDLLIPTKWRRFRKLANLTNQHCTEGQCKTQTALGPVSRMSR